MLLAGVGCSGEASDSGSASDIELRPNEGASQAFWDHWSDGKAELSAYEIVTPRYGEPRDGHVVLVYVTEEMNKQTLIKDDTGDVPPENKEVVLKLNHTMNFRTGIYPYSVMTSVFSPVGSSGRERFAPAKISFTAQEWCGHVFQMVTPRIDAFDNTIRSYFSWEGDRDETIETMPFTLYEDALYIQLRELDGPFEGGGDWSGRLVPSLWTRRMTHMPLRPVDATITREEAERDGAAITRFTLRYEVASPGPDGEIRQVPLWRRFDVETANPHRILAWETSSGERAQILGSTRLPYWQLNANGDERYLAELGLDPASASP
jgi:hypothetical protein